MKLSQRVKSLVEAGKYDEAITTLSSVNHPKALQWIQQIEARQRVAQKKAQRTGVMIVLFLCFLCACICPLYFWFQ